MTHNTKGVEYNIFITSLFERLPRPFKIINSKYSFNDKYPILWSDVVTYGMDINIDVLKQFWSFRKNVVDYILNTVIKTVKCNKCTYHSVGSTTFTSDYDVSVFGPNKEDVVKMFNELFVKIFGAESGEVFDSNIYGVTSLIPIKNDSKKGPPYSTVKSCSKKKCQVFKYIKIPKGITVDISNQRSWAFIKLFRYLNKAEINNFIKSANKLGITLLNSDLENSMERYRQSKKLGDPNNLNLMNKKYNEMLMRVKRTRRRMETHPKNILYKDAESHANYFSQDSYYTQGAFNHSVGLLQMGVNELEITNNELIDSCIENTGDLIRELNRLQHKIKKAKLDIKSGRSLKRSCARTVYEEKECVTGVIKVSKYWMRLLDSIHRIQLKVPDFEVGPFSRSVIKKAIDNTEHLRQEMRGKKLEKDCKSATCVNVLVATNKVKELLDMFHISSSLNDVRKNMIIFLLEVLEAHYKGTKGQSGGDSCCLYLYKYKKYKNKYLQLKLSL